MKLAELIQEIGQDVPTSFADMDILSIHSDSRLVVDHSVFIALKGPNHNGCDFISDAVNNGAQAVIYDGEDDIAAGGDLSSICFIKVDDARQSLKRIAQKFYGNLSNQIKVIGITGTNGKTTITYLLESIFQQINRRCGVIGTVNYRIGDEVFPSKNTTPGILENQELLKDLIAKQVDYCIMEVSSHALDQGRVDLIDFYATLFTNLTQDHLDYHKTQEEYFQAKAKLFTPLKEDNLAIINADDPFGERLKAMTKAKVLSYGFTDSPEVTISQLHTNINGSSFQIVTPWGSNSVETPLIGKHNVYNIMASVTLALGENVDPEDIFAGINNLRVIPGRLERIANDRGIHVFVDYAHTEDGLRNVLESLKAVAPKRIITVFGCGGDRDKSKRPLMGKAADQYSDLAIITTDNPRSEDPQSIADQIVDGMASSNYTVVLDRKEAIHSALSQAQNGDVVLIAGKGHEDFQVFKDKTMPFDDREVVRDVLQQTCSK